MAECDADPSQELVHAERFGEVVIGARVERTHLVRFHTARRKDDDWDPRPLGQAPGDLDAVAVGQAQVDEDEARLAHSGLSDALTRRRRLEPAVAVALEGDTEELPHGRLVLDPENERAHVAHGAGSSGGGSPTGSVNEKR